MTFLKFMILTFMLLCGSSILSLPAFAQIENPDTISDTLENTPQATAENTATDLPEENIAASAALPPEDPFDLEVYRQAQEDLERYQQFISELETGSGQNAYRVELVEAYLDLGSTLRILERHEESVAAFDKALQAARVSNGLNSLLQIPILEEMRQTQEEQANWENYDSNTHLIHYISAKNFEAGDERRIQVTQELGQWQLRVAREELLPGFRNKAFDALTLYNNEIRFLETTENYEEKNIHLASMHLGRAAASHTIATILYKQPLEDFSTGTTRRTIQQRQCLPVKTPDGRVIMVCQIVEMPDLNYYIDPSNKKSADIGRQLRDMKTDVITAYDLLQQATDDLETRDLLLAQVQELTEKYNTFVSGESR